MNRGSYRTEYEFVAKTESDEDVTLNLEIEYLFTPGNRGSAPSLSHAGRPAEGASVEIERAWIKGGAKLVPLPEPMLDVLANDERLLERIAEDAC